MGQFESLQISTGQRASTGAASITRMGVSSTIIRFYVTVEPGAVFRPGQGYAFWDLGAESLASIRTLELALVNTNDFDSPPSMQLLQRLTAGGGVLWTSEYEIISGYPVYVELYAAKGPPGTMHLWYLDDDRGERFTADLEGADLGRHRFGVLRHIGTEDLPRFRTFISGIAGADDPSHTANQLPHLGTLSTDAAPAVPDPDDTLGEPSCLIGERVWWTQHDPAAVHARNLTSPGHQPYEFIPSQPNLESYGHPPIHITGRVLVPFHDGTDTYFYVLDASTGAPLHEIVLEDTLLHQTKHSAVPGTDAGFYALDDGLSIVCVDPFQPGERWRRKLAANTDEFGQMLSWPILPALFAVSDENVVTPSLKLYDDSGEVLHTVGGAVDFGRVIAVGEEGDAIFNGAGFGAVTLRRRLVGDYRTDTLVENVRTLTAGTYALSSGSNPTAVPNGRAPVSAIHPTAFYFARSMTPYATNAQVQEIRVDSLSRDLQTQNWQVSICSNLSANTALGCTLGSLQTDEAGNVYMTYKHPEADESDSGWMLRIIRPDGTFVPPEVQLAGPGYPQAGTDLGSYLRIVRLIVATPTETWLVSEADYSPFDSSISASATLDSPDTPAPHPTRRLRLPLSPTSLAPAGVFEICEKIENRLERLVFAGDVRSGLELTRNLSELDALTFAIPVDKFEPSAGDRAAGFLSELQSEWQREHPGSLAPYDKFHSIRDHAYCVYNEPDGRVRAFRIDTIDIENSKTLTGAAIDASVELADLLTQYSTGRSQFVGAPVSDVAKHVLKANQAMFVQNRRFARDAPVRMVILDEIPNLKPGGTPPESQPVPYIVPLQAANPNEPDRFSGLPYATVPPHGTERDLQVGYFGYHGFNDTSITLGHFTTLVSDGDSGQRVAGPLNINQSTAYKTGENTTYVSRIIYGAIFVPTDGVYSFRLNLGASNYARVYWRGQRVVLAAGNVWEDDLEGGRFYPFIIHHIVASATQTCQLFWTAPGAAEVLVPAANMTNQLHGGLFFVRFVDVDGVTRWFTAYKRWDGKAIILGFPISHQAPESVPAPAIWSGTLPAGALIEETRHPKDVAGATVQDWGTGWTRKPGPRQLTKPPSVSTRFQLDSQY